MNKLKLKGRPKKGKFECFGTQAWFYAVQNVSNGKTAYSLEKEFFPTRFKNVKDKVIRPRLFDRYQNGKISVGNDDLIDLVEKSYPGAAIWLNAILWNILDDRCSDLEIHFWLQALDKQLVECFFKTEIMSGDSVKIKKINQKNFKKLKHYDLLDVFTLTVLAVLMSIQKENWESLVKALYGYHQIRPKLQDHVIFSKFYANFLSELDVYFIRMGEQTFGQAIPLIVWEYDSVMSSHANMISSTVHHNKPEQHVMSDAAYITRAQVSCFENYYCQGDLKITIRLYHFIPIGLSLLSNIDAITLISFASKFYLNTSSSRNIEQDKENIIAMTMMFGDEQDWGMLEHLLGIAVLQEITYFNKDRFGQNLTTFWQKRLGLMT